MLNDMQYGSSTSRYTPRYLSLKFHSLLISSMIICPFQSTWKWLQPYGVNGTQRKRVWEMSDIIQHFFLSLLLSHLCSNNDGICYHFFLPLSLPYQQIASFIWTFFSALCLKARDSFISEQLFQAICCVLWNCTLPPHYYYPRMNDDRVKYRHECINLSPWRQRALLMIASEISIHMLSGEA